VAAVLGLASCAARTVPPAAAPAPSPSAAVHRHTHENLNAVLWMQQAAEYEIAAEGAYARALDLLQAGLVRARADRSWSAAVEQQGGDYSALPPAVVMDLDETVLDNSPVQARQVLRGEAEFDPKAWGAWVDRKAATLVPGALRFVLEARKSASVIFVTNRNGAEEPATLANLAALGLPTDAADVLSLGEPGPDGQRWPSDKTSRRTWLAARYRILLLVGDDLGDFVSAQGKTPEQRREVARAFEAYWRDRWVVLPNPTYGSWERATFDRALPDADRLDMKRRLLRAFEEGRP
jgi:acid phosphatase